MKTIAYTIVLLIIISSTAFCQAVWRQYQGPYNGNALSFTSNQETIFCGVDLTGIYKSDNNGWSWQTTGINYGNIMSMHYWDSKLFASLSNAVYVSENNGEDWTQCSGIGWTNLFYSFNDKLFAGTEKGVYIYDVGQNSWSPLNVGLPDDDGMGSRNVSGITSVDNALFCGLLSQGLYQSTDEGQTWEKVLSHSGFDELWVYHLVNFHNKLILVPHGTERKLFISDDVGASWSSIDFVRQDNSFQSLVQFNDDLLVVTNKGVYELDEHGLTFSVFNDAVFELAYTHGTDLYGSNKTGIYKWNGSDFELSNNGINSARVYDIASYNNALYCATSGGAYFTRDDGETWNVVPDSDGSFCYTVEASENKLFIGSGSNGIISYSKDDDNWQPANNGLSSHTIWQIKAGDGILYAATDAGLYQSDNEGAYWNHIKNYSNQIINVTVEGDLVLATQAYNMIYKVSEDRTYLEPLVSLYDGLEVLTKDKTSTNYIYFDDTHSIESIHIIDSVVYVSIGNSGLFISRDTCKTWERHLIFGVVDVSKRGDENIYASSRGNIYYSPDEGITWQDWSETGMPDFLINCIFQGEENMYAGTLGNSVYKREYLSETELYSDEYNIDGSSVTGVPEGTSDSKLKAGLSCSHGASIFVSTNTTPNAVESNYLKSDAVRTVKIIAEDGKTEKVYLVANNTSVGSMEGNKFKLYPNPANDEIFISHDSGKPVQVQVFNMQGELVLDVSEIIDSVNISSLQRGVYLVKVLIEGKDSSFKLLKK